MKIPKKPDAAASYAKSDAGDTEYVGWCKKCKPSHLYIYIQQCNKMPV